MKTYSYTLLYIVLLGALVLTGCSENLFDNDKQQEGNRIQLAADIDQVAVSRVNDNGFCDGDKMGVYIVDYEGDVAGTLKANGNHADNVGYTFDATNNKWIGTYDLFWTDKHTSIDVYGYYPYASPESIDNYQFEVQKDQSKATEDGEMGGYEASDFLWGKVADVAPTSSTIRLPLSHRMANARVTLVMGSGFEADEWANTDKVVLTANVARKASINLADGTVKPASGIESTATIPSRVGDEWRTIVIPQTIKAGTTLFSITIGGIPYKFTKNEDFTYVAGKMNNFAIRVDKKGDEGQYKLTLISESITPWENDLVSHDATAKEYVVIHSTAGGLKAAIAAAHKDYTKIKNLKITGDINELDFEFMKNEMTSIEALNLKEVTIKAYDRYPADEIPGLPGVPVQLIHIILPDNLKSIGDGGAFSHRKQLVGSIVIPEGVTTIGRAAFAECSGIDGTLSLPSTVKRIGEMAFEGCSGLTGTLTFPEGLEVIENFAFLNCNGLYGELRLPSSLKEIGERAFMECSGLTGSLTIPQNIKSIPDQAFCSCGFDGNLILPSGLTTIKQGAFLNCHFKGELVLPNTLKSIENDAFSGNYFSGNLTLPNSLVSIGSSAFSNNIWLTGTITIPDEITSIKERTFEQCSNIEGLVFPSNIESINKKAFANCTGIHSIVCKGADPAYVRSGAFDGVPKDNFTVEVPEASVAQYQTAQGWSEFKRIAAHHELTCKPKGICALGTGRKQTVTLYAEGKWEVASKPDWCEVSPTSGHNKTPVTITINSMGKGTESREGKVVFRLKEQDYTHECAVSQYGYEYDEDEWITLQKATQGNTGGINIVLLGDGYDAKDIANGKYLKNIKQEMEYFFAIEPYKTYRKYFNVYTAIPLSTESGVGTVNTIRYNRFGTTYTTGVGLRANYDDIFAYALGAPTVNKGNLNQTLIIIVPNSTEYGGITQMWEDGAAISFCPQSSYSYPLDSRGVLQHEAGGHGFGKLADEYIYHNAFIQDCGCTCCPHTDAVNQGKSLGWYDNISLTGKTHNVGWSHLIYNDRYSDIVDIYEGAFMHSRGVFRSEANSCMNNDIPYFSTISRESIVKRIKRYAGESYSFDDFVKNDKRDAGNVASSRSHNLPKNYRSARNAQHAPCIHKGSPLRMAKVRRHR